MNTVKIHHVSTGTSSEVYYSPEVVEIETSTFVLTRVGRGIRLRTVFGWNIILGVEKDTK